MGNPLIAGGRRWLLPGTVIALLVAALVGTLVAPPELTEYIGFVGLLLGMSAAGFLLFRRSRDLSPKERRAWRWIGIALLSLLTGVLVLGVLSVIGVSVGSFSALDIFFLGAYAALIVALYQLARLDSGGQEWMLTLVDALVGSIAMAALVWSFVFAELRDAMAGADWWEAAIAIIYPVADVLIIIALLILVIRRSHYHLDLRLIFLTIGGTAQVLADFIFLNDGVGKTFATAEPAYALNLLAAIFLVLTAAIVDRVPAKREFPEAPTPIWAIIWPYLLAAALFGVHFDNYRQLNPGSSEILLLDAVILIGVVIIFRQVYVIFRDRHRVDVKRAELVASVSHELRTPLTAMVGFLSLLDEYADEFPEDAKQEMISEAAGQARHMSRLVSDLLMLAKGDASPLSLEILEVPAIGIVTSVLRTADVGDTRIDQDLDADVMVRVDPDRIRQALGNLLTNAIRYGGDQCLVVARAVGRDLTIEIHDNGGGVPTRYESTIWQHFERGAHRLDAATPGLGIGLSIVQAVAESHGGRAEYRKSERLGGACFVLTIPGCVVASESAASKVPADASRGGEGWRDAIDI